MFDLLNWNDKTIQHRQSDDLVALAYIILGLCRAPQDSILQPIDLSLEELLPNAALRNSFVYMNEKFPRLGQVVLFLLTKSRILSQQPFIVQLSNMLNTQFVDQLSQSLNYQSSLEGQLGAEISNGRMFRLLVKLVTVIDRPLEEVEWSSTGDRYPLMLFRDFVFHSLLAPSVPQLDWGFVVEQLMKLDIGSEEKICLSSRDGDNVLVCQYSDLKRLLETSYQELVQKQYIAFQQIQPM